MAAPQFLGIGKPGQTVSIPFQSNITKSFRIHGISVDDKLQRSESDFAYAEFVDVNVPGPTTVESIVSGGTDLDDLIAAATANPGNGYNAILKTSSTIAARQNYSVKYFYQGIKRLEVC